MSPKPAPTLTDREKEVITLIAEGLSNHAIADRLVISYHTVTWHVKQIYSKLGVKRRTEAVAVARSLGLLDDSSAESTMLLPDETGGTRHNLPPQPTRFIGRQDEIAEIDRLLDSDICRLLTLVGPGGNGKTRLALEIAGRKLDSFANGIFFVPLQPLTSPENIVQSIVDALSLQFQPNSRVLIEQLGDYLRNKSVLLLLDNFEHLLEGAEIVSRLLSTSPQIKILATSREALNLREEQIYSVRGLQVPDNHRVDTAKDFSGVTLFAERAHQVYPDFSLADQLMHVVSICQLVDGMPLALELAASWLKTLSCQEIVLELEQGLDILATPLRNMPERHRSIQVVFDHSWRFLNDSEQRTFQRLSVFRNGCTRQAAQQVTGASDSVLQALADKSFIRRNPDNGRYDIHELLRQYGEFKLAQSPEDEFSAHDAHCDYFAVLLGQHRENVSDHRQREMMHALEPDLDNIRAAWQWAVDHLKTDNIQQALHTFVYFHIFRSRFQEEALSLEAAIARFAGSASIQASALLAAVLSYCGWIYVRIGAYSRAETQFWRSRELYQQLQIPAPPGWASEPHTGLAMLASIQGDYVEAEQYGEKALEISDNRNDQWNRQLALYGMTSASFHQGKYEAAQRYAEQAYAISLDSGDQWFRAIILNDLGLIARVQRYYAQAREHFRASLAIRQDFHDSQGMAAALNHLGSIAVLDQDYEEAMRLYRESYGLYKEIGDQGGTGYALCGLGMVALELADYQQARRNFFDALQIARDIQYASLTFSILLGVSELLLHTKRPHRSFDLLALILSHGRSDSEAKDRAKQILASLGSPPDSAFDPGDTEAVHKRGSSLDLDTTVQELLVELANLAV